MKLKIQQLFSQRDSTWASILLGYNTLPQYNIGLYGCLITCFGMYLNNQPNNVNQLLKDNGGFVQGGGDFIWSKSTVLGLNQTYISPRYEDAVTSQGIAKMKELLDADFPLVCEIDFNPATTGEEMHFVLIIGYDGSNFIAGDPWTGSIISLDVYGGVARAVLQFRAYDKKLEQEIDSTAIILQQSDAFIAICTKLNLPANRDIVLAELDKLIQMQDIVLEKDKALSEAQVKTAELEKTISNKQGELETLQENLRILKEQADQASEDNKILQEEVKQLKEGCEPKPVFTGWRKILYNLFFK